MRTKAFWLFLSLLAACVPENTAGSAAFDKSEHKAAVKTENKEAEELSFSADAVGSYILYLQARQDGDYEKAVSFLSATVKADPDNAALISEMLSLLAYWRISKSSEKLCSICSISCLQTFCYPSEDC